MPTRQTPTAPSAHRPGVWPAVLLGLTLLFGAAAARAWSNHAMATQVALGELAEVRGAEPVAVESIEQFLQSQAAALEALLATEEAWARANVPTYPARPEALAFRAGPAPVSPAELRRRFIAAVRINPDSRLALFSQRLAGQDDGGRTPLNWSKVTTLRGDGTQIATRFVALSEGERVSPLEVLSSASDEPDYGLDLGLWADSGGPASAAYGLGTQPFGNPALEYSGQAPMHMGFFHEAAIIYTAAGFLKRTYPEYRVHLYQALARHAFKTGHPYWGWRFGGWALHYVQDLTQPYHARVLPGVGPARMLWVNAIDMAGFHGAKNDAVTLVSNRHTALENYQYWVMRRALERGDAAHPVLAALRDRSHDPAPPWRDDTLRNVVTQESHAASDRLDEVLAGAMPARYVSDPGYTVGVTEPKLDLAELVARGPADARARLDTMLAALLSRCGAHSRAFVLDLIATTR